MIRIDPRSLARLDEIRRSMLNIAPALSITVSAATVDQAFEKARAGADKHTRTGALVRSLKTRRKSEYSYEIYHDTQIAPHALFVHWGTKAHEIKPKQNRPNPHLRWVGPNGFVFAKRVWHPGYKGDPYLLRARDSVARTFGRIAQEAWGRLTRRFR